MIMFFTKLNRKNRKAIKLMKQNGFSVVEDATKYYFKKTKRVFFYTQSDPFKIFKDDPKMLEEYGLESAGLYALPFEGEELDTSYIEFE